VDEAGTWHGGRPQPRRLCVRWKHSPPPKKKGSEPPPQFSAHFYCGQTVGCIKMSLGMDVGLSPVDFVLDGDPVPHPKKGADPPNFRPMFMVAKWLDASRCHLARTRPQPRRLCVRWGPSLLHTKGVEPLPQFSAYFYCSQTAGCIKMPLGMEVGLSPGDFVLDGVPGPFQKRRRSPGRSPQFSAMSIVAKRLNGSRWHLAWR